MIMTVTVSIIVWNAQRLSEALLDQQIEVRAQEVASLLALPLAPALARRDAQAIENVLNTAQQPAGIAYLLVFDENGERIGASDWESNLNARNKDYRNRHVSDAPLPTTYRQSIQYAGTAVGELQYGLDRNFGAAVRDTALRQNLLLALVGVLAAAAALAAAARGLTRRLDVLSQASRKLGTSERFTPILNEGADDIAALVDTFNTMGLCLETRLADLSRSETEQRRLATQRESERRHLATLLGAIRLGLVYIDVGGRVQYANAAFNSLWGLTATEMQNNTVDHLRARTQAQLKSLESICCPECNARELLLNDGRIFSQGRVPVYDANNLEAGWLWMFEDMTEARKMQARLRFMAEHDPLTGLANRSRFQTELQLCLQRQRRHPQHGGALLYFDVDDFKRINDSHGHNAGDRVLKQIALSVGRLVRTDELFARLGGDEFAIIAPGADRGAAQTLATRILDALTTLKFDFDVQGKGPTFSLGIALYPEHGNDADLLVTNADFAMYEAKRAGKNRWQVFAYDTHSTHQETALMDHTR